MIAPSYSFRETAHAIALAGAPPVFADIDYWSGTVVPEKVEAAITDEDARDRRRQRQRPSGQLDELREFANKHDLLLIEDSTEAIGSKYKDALVGTFGDVSIFDFSQPSPLTAGEGGMIVTDDLDIAVALRRAPLASAPGARFGRRRLRRALSGGDERYFGGAGPGAIARLDEILERGARSSISTTECPVLRGHQASLYRAGRDRGALVPLCRASRDTVLEIQPRRHRRRSRVEKVEAAAYCNPLHLQRRYFDLGYRRGDLSGHGKVADRAVALPFHCHLSEDQIEFIVATMKDASVNVGAGAAIY